MVAGIVIPVALAALLVNALARPIILPDYVTPLRSRKADRRAQSARNLAISTLIQKSESSLHSRLGLIFPRPSISPSPRGI